MSKTEQQKFGQTEIVKSHKQGICEQCGNSSFLVIKSRYARTHYCKQHARNCWINEAEELEQ